ncbi:MAG TPA: M43 family zinc metalloprotease [Bacteroidia bacterium]|nr:M43 family zinc metalloprotease [Bacteroidia bacterium]
MKKYYLPGCIEIMCIMAFAGLNKSNGQTVPCLFDKYQSENYIAVQKAGQQISSYIQQNFSQKHLSHGSIFKIPVVVHIIHDGGAENISDAQVQSQIDVLNEDYRKIFGTNGYGNGVDTEIEFCLAKLDPDGDCTNGIVRIKSALAYHDSYERPALSQLSSWDPLHYLNIYVVKTIAGGVLGYASFPGGPADQDGVVMVHNAFGTVGTAQPPYNLGRTCSHESGHWFGLYHTFNGGCGIDTCAEGDLVCDTPPVINPNFNCPNINTCHNDVPDVNDQVENYMDYTNDACKSMFTAGQRDRMQATLNIMRYDIWQPSNITATGCDSGFVSPPCNVVADFVANGTQICQNNTVTFTNKTLNSPTSFQWNFSGGNPATDTTLNPTVTYNILGNFDVTLIATGSLGSDTVTFYNYINVTLPQPGQAIPYDETFEQIIFPPNGIVIDNPDNGITWERDTIAVMYEGYASAKINNLINTNYGQSDAMILPDYDLTTFTGIPYLTFRWAYAKSDVNFSDELLVLLSTDCGLTFTQVFYRTGAAMTTGPTQITPYIPDSNTVWKLATINLNPYIAFNNVRIKIINVTDGGNNLYIDSLHIGSILSTGIGVINSDAFNVYPNPFSNNLTIELPKTQNESVVLTLFDALGRTIDAKTVKHSLGKQEICWRPELTSNNKLFVLEIKMNEIIIRKKIIYQSVK